MSITLIIIVSEILIVLLAIVGTLFYFRWKRQKVKTIEFEKLLTNFESLVDDRKAQLIHMLKESYEMEIEEAEESASYMIEAEKQFLQEFLKQQIEKTPVNDFYLHLSELLDQYLYFVPKLNDESNNNNIEQTQVSETEENGGLEKAESVEELNENKDSETNTFSPDIETPEKNTDSESDLTEINRSVDDSGEDTKENLESVQDESADLSESETVTDEYNSESEETEGEPDWGDAFAESGDEVDEATEAAFEAEKDKD